MSITDNKEEYISEILSHKLDKKYKATLIKFKTNQYSPDRYHCVIKRQNGSYFWVDISKTTIDFYDLDNSLNAFLNGLKLI